MELHVKTYGELTKDELYDILHIRAAIFVVGQNSVYQDVDYQDQASLHLFYTDTEGIQAYLRIIPEPGSADEVHIGRVLTRKHRTGLGTRLFQEGMKAAKQHFGALRIKIMSQVQAQGFYEKFGFTATSEPFMDEGLLHINMLRDLE